MAQSVHEKLERTLFWFLVLNCLTVFCKFNELGSLILFKEENVVIIQNFLAVFWQMKKVGHTEDQREQSGSDSRRSWPMESIMPPASLFFVRFETYALLLEPDWLAMYSKLGSVFLAKKSSIGFTYCCASVVDGRFACWPLLPATPPVKVYLLLMFSRVSIGIGSCGS